MLSTLIGYVANSCGLSQTFTDKMEFRAFVNIPLAACVLVPLSLMRDFSSLAFASMLSLLALTYTGLLMIVELPWYNDLYRNHAPELSIRMFSIDMNFF